MVVKIARGHYKKVKTKTGTKTVYVHSHQTHTTKGTKRKKK